MPADANSDCEYVSKEWLLAKLRSNDSNSIVIDCRGSNEYAVSHVRSAVNFSIPSIMLRRLAAGKINLVSTVQCKELKARIGACNAGGMFVLYSDTSSSTAEGDTVHSILLRRLKQDGVRVVCLEGDFEEFRQCYPEWCIEAPADRPPTQLPLMGLRSLRISPGLFSEERGSSGSGSDSEECMGGKGHHLPQHPQQHHHHQDFPVEILPNLFLGNSANSEDCEGLAKHNIKYILNVTQDLPNVFESDTDINYLKIPIADHWSQNLATYFPEAINFIEEGVSSNCGVLIHCVAGISRSVTVTVAYLMQRHRLSLNDAFALVRSRKADVAPNFHFLRQLHCLERDLGLDTESRSLSKVLEEIGVGSTGSMMSRRQDSGEGRGPPDSGFERCTPSSLGAAGGRANPSSVGPSPDSGIEIFRWGGAHDTPQ